MTLKGWVLGKVNPTARPGGDRGERVAPSVGAAVDLHDAREPALRDGGARARGGDEHLGRYAPLVAAIREALEAFVANELRLHLAIAERDRYVLTSIDVECSESDEHRELLQRFMHEFKPEQVKQYLARDVIAGLRNASAIDLTQFGGLNASRVTEEADEEDPYRELVAQLQSADTSPAARPYAVTIVGRWAEDRAPHLGPGPRPRAPRAASPTELHTPLAARPLVLDVQDAGAARRVQVAAEVPSRRHVVGKGEAADIVVEGVYASRRHCELWYDAGAWWVQDLGSTNGIRVESRGTVRRAGGPRGQEAAPLELVPGALLVLSAHGEGAPSDYPRLVAAATDAAEAPEAGTLVTPIAPARRARATYVIAAETATGVQQTEVPDDALPFRIGRSRNLGLVIDWIHADVSGLHLEITAIDETGVAVSVLGDNGVRVGTSTFAPGARLHWLPGEAIVLGRLDAPGPRCTLTLARAGS